MKKIKTRARALVLTESEFRTGMALRAWSRRLVTAPLERITVSGDRIASEKWGNPGPAFPGVR